MKCLIAQCVIGCASCSNLRDCSACNTGLLLDPINHYCDASCPPGQYFLTGDTVCRLCDPHCY